MKKPRAMVERDAGLQADLSVAQGESLLIQAQSANSHPQIG